MLPHDMACIMYYFFYINKTGCPQKENYFYIYIILIVIYTFLYTNVFAPLDQKLDQKKLKMLTKKFTYNKQYMLRALC